MMHFKQGLILLLGSPVHPGNVLCHEPFGQILLFRELPRELLLLLRDKFGFQRPSRAFGG